MNKNMNTSDSLHSPIVSVIIPTYNRSEMLIRSIESVLYQTYKDFELIIVSDGSTDGTDKIVASYADPRIRFLKHEKSRGASAARNTGIRASIGTYIAFLDDDDEWTHNKLEVQVPIIEKSAPEVGLVYAWMEYFENGKSRRIHAPELRGNVFVEMLDKQAIGGCPTVIIKREIIKNVGYFDESLLRGNDGDYWRRISKQYQVDFVPEVLAKIFIGHENRISVNSHKNINDEIIAFEKRLQFFKDDFDKHPFQKIVVYSKIVSSCLNCGNFNKCFHYFKGVLKSDITFKQKVSLIYKILNSLMSFCFYKTSSIFSYRKIAT